MQKNILTKPVEKINLNQQKYPTIRICSEKGKPPTPPYSEIQTMGREGKCFGKDYQAILNKKRHNISEASARIANACNLPHSSRCFSRKGEILLASDPGDPVLCTYEIPLNSNRQLDNQSQRDQLEASFKASPFIAFYTKDVLGTGYHVYVFIDRPRVEDLHFADIIVSKYFREAFGVKITIHKNPLHTIPLMPDKNAHFEESCYVLPTSSMVTKVLQEIENYTKPGEHGKIQIPSLFNLMKMGLKEGSKEEPIPTEHRPPKSASGNASETVVGDSQYTTPTLPEWIFHSLPAPLKRRISKYKYNPRKRDIALLSIVCSSALALNNIRVRYGGKWEFIVFYVLISGGPGAGKSVIQCGYDNALQLSNHVYAKSLEDIAAAKEDSMDSEHRSDQKQLPVRIICPLNTSNSALIKELSAAGQSILLYDTELASMMKNSSESWSAILDILCKAFHGEPISILRNNFRLDIKDPKISFLASCTTDQAFEFLSNTSDGTFSRIIPYHFTDVAEWDESVFNPKSQESEPEAEDDFLLPLYNHLENSETKSFQWENADHRKALNAMSKEWYDSIRKINGNSDCDASIQRLGLFTTRLAATLTCLFEGIKWIENNCIEDDFLKEKFTCSDEIFQISVTITSVLKEHIIHFYENMSANKPKKLTSNNARKIRFYDQLPDMFSSKQAVEIAFAIGISERTVFNYLNQLQEDKLLEKAMKAGQYIKSSKKHSNEK